MATPSEYNPLNPSDAFKFSNELGQAEILSQVIDEEAGEMAVTRMYENGEIEVTRTPLPPHLRIEENYD